MFKVRFRASVFIRENLLKVGVPFGWNLTLSSRDAIVVNLQRNDLLKQELRRVWICPESFDCSSVNSMNSSDLIINHK